MEKLPLVLLPGLLCDAGVWRYQIEHLGGIADIIVPDFSTTNTPHAMVKAVLDVAPASFALAGHSMGGWVALEVMKHAGQRVSRLCLLNTTAKLDSVEKATARNEMIALAKENAYDKIIDRLLKGFVYRQSCIQPVKVMLERNKYAFINQEMAMIQRDDCMPVLNLIRCPTLVIHADHDALFTMADSELLATIIPQAHLAIVSNSGHMSPMEAPERVTELMRQWLTAD